MQNSETFATELSYIVNDNLRNFIAQCLDGLPDYFRHIGASIISSLMWLYRKQKEYWI